MIDARASNRERLRTLRTGLSVRPISRTRFITGGFLSACKRFLRCPLSSHRKSVTLEKTVTDSSINLVLTALPKSFSWTMDVFSVKMSRTTARSREVLIILSLSLS